MNYAAIQAKQRAYFLSGATRGYEARLAALTRLRGALKEHTPAIQAALLADLGKQPYESALCETGQVMGELDYHIRHLKRWMRERRQPTNLSSFPARSFLAPEPYGLALIISPWNYPAQLLLEPLIGALSAGNCAVLKPSVKAPETGRAVAEMLRSVFPEEYVYVAEGSRTETAQLLELAWDTIFFTGSKSGGQQILEAAAKHLTPVTLELGGKSPVIVDATADLKKAARRIAFGKVINAGQTCVAPDYLLIHESVLEPFLEQYRAALKKYFPKGNHDSMVRIVNSEHFLRLTAYMDGAELPIGGEADPESRRIQPAVLTGLSPDAPVLREEVFGPLLPVLTWTELDWCIDYIRAREKPLALYLFSRDKAVCRRVLDSCSFGGGCINDTLLHAASPTLPFGGVGASGMGSYHGKKSFDTFTHYRGVVDRRGSIDPSLRRPPYTRLKRFFLRFILK